MSNKITYISLKKLAVDRKNIRGGEWVSDEDLIDSIKQHGVIEPLIVRLAPKKEKADYTIVAGSRRFFASQEGGLKEAPCIIKELTDAQALGLSITENKDRKDLPVWRVIEKVKEYFEEINGNLPKEEKIRIAQEELRLSKGTSHSYINLIMGNKIVFELMKPNEERSQEVRTLLKRVGADGDTTKQLTLTIAEKISTKLEGLSTTKQLEVAVILLGKSRELADELISKVIEFPKISAQELYEKKVLKIPMGRSFSFTFGAHVVKGVEEAMIREGMDRKTLVSRIIEEWLKKRKYI